MRNECFREAESGSESEAGYRQRRRERHSRRSAENLTYTEEKWKSVQIRVRDGRGRYDGCVGGSHLTVCLKRFSRDFAQFVSNDFQSCAFEGEFWFHKWPLQLPKQLPVGSRLQGVRSIQRTAGYAEWFAFVHPGLGS